MVKFIVIAISFLIALNKIFAEDSIIIQSTTSTKNVGFYEYILPYIYQDLGIKAKVVALGTGAAIRNAMNCDGDLLIAHSPLQEKKFIQRGFADKSYYFMHNSFIIIGPKSDPSKIRNKKTPENALKQIYYKKKRFISRGDNSGTHFKEQSIWKKLKLKPKSYSGDWYLETGTSMGATLNTAVGLGAYTLTDRASWITFKNKLDFEVMIKEGKNLENRYSALAIKKNKCPFTKEKESRAIISWLISKKGKKIIQNFKKNGEQHFFVKSD